MTYQLLKTKTVNDKTFYVEKKILKSKNPILADSTNDTVISFVKALDGTSIHNPYKAVSYEKTSKHF